MMSDDLVAYLDGECSNEQAKLIEQALERDQVLRNQLAVLVRQRVLLAELCAVQRAGNTSSTTNRESVSRLRPSTSNKPISSTSHRRVKNINSHKKRRTLGFNPLVPVIIVGAAVLVLTVLLLHSMASPASSATRSPEMVREVVTAPVSSQSAITAIGRLSVLRGGNILQAVAGDGLLNNDGLEATEVSGIRYSDGSAIALAAGSRLELQTAEHGGKQLLVHQGEITAEVTGQPVSAPLRIVTKVMTATVIGTRLSVRVSDEQTRVAVFNGLVRVQGVNGPSHDIPGGGWAEARPGIPLQISNRPVWSISGQWGRVITGGDVIRDQVGTEMGVRSIKTLDSQLKPEFKPDQYICVQSGEHGSTDPHLVRLPKDFVVKLHLRAERAGRLIITLASESGSGEGDHRVEELPIAAGWNDVVLPSSQFVTEGRGVPNNYPLWALVIWGFGVGQLELNQVTIEQSQSMVK